MCGSILQLSSFEKTTDHLFVDIFHMKRDAAEGMSECITLGRSIGIGVLFLIKVTNVCKLNMIRIFD